MNSWTIMPNWGSSYHVLWHNRY